MISRVVLRIVFLPILWLLYGISAVFPRDPRIWVFGDYDGRFSDNAKYFFLDVWKRCKGLRAIWISSNRRLVRALREAGFEAYFSWSPRGMYYAMRAGVWFFTFSSKDINFWLSGGRLLKINLWHGIPLKRIEHDARKGVVSLRSRAENNIFLRALFHLVFPWHFESVMHRNYFLLATSSLVAKLFSSAFRVPLDHVIVSEYPRCKVFFEDFSGQEFGIDMRAHDFILRAKNSGKHVIFYAPTFRDDGSDPKILDVVDWSDLDSFLEEHNAVLFVKPHLSSALRTLPPLRNVVLVDPRSDAYPLLRYVDVLITDYSSIYFDFLLLDRPIIFFCYDLEDYMRKSRELYFKYEDVTPGYKVRTYSDLKQAILAAIRGSDPFAADRKRVRELMFDPEVDLLEHVRQISHELL